MRWSMMALLSPAAVHAQMIVPQPLCALPSPLGESSGLLMVDGALWTVLDSGNPNSLYQVDPATCAVTRTVQLLSATNFDFEELAADENWIYIGDFGNNSGTRTDLRVFRIPREALVNEAITEVEVDTIRFSYADQTDFTPQPYSNNFDCEAFIAADDSLFLFSKRWVDSTTRMYALPASPGTHVAEPRADYDTDGVVTAASWDGADRLVLLGYDGFPGQPFIAYFNNIQGHDFLGQLGVRRTIDLFIHQTEGIAWFTPEELIMSNEASGGFAATLWAFDVLQTVTEENNALGIRAFPVPADQAVQFVGHEQKALGIRIVDGAGRMVLEPVLSQSMQVDVSTLETGRYIALITLAKGTVSVPFQIAR